MRWLDIVSGKDRGLVASSARFSLYLLSRVYGVAIKVRNQLYDWNWLRSEHAPIPVVSVGNLTVGGTGKTPTVVMLAKWFRDRGVRVAILSRGYGAGIDGRNDEAREIELKLDDVPHLQNPDRVESSRIAVEELDMQVLLLDDGFQHRRLKRDLEIVVIDATNPFGYGYLLPRGLLRESPRSLRRAQVVMLSRCDQATTQQLAEIRSRVQRWAPNAAWVETEHRPVQLRNTSGAVLPIDSLRGRLVLCFCGIGNPKAFKRTVEATGAQLAKFRVFPDHHLYSAADIDSIAMDARQLTSVEMILCTGKDLAKVGADEIGGIPLWAIDIELDVRFGCEALEERLDHVCQAAGSRDAQTQKASDLN